MIESVKNKKTRPFAVAAARLLHDLHCTDILLLDVCGRSDITDYILIATGTSDRQIRSVGESVEELGLKYDYQRFGCEIDARTSWVVVDFAGLVVHLFDFNARNYYDIEMMWGDAPKIRWRHTVKKPAEE